MAQDTQTRDPLKDLYNEFNPSLKLAKDFNEFKDVMQNKESRIDFFNTFNPKLKLAKDINEFDDVLGFKEIPKEPFLFAETYLTPREKRPTQEELNKIAIDRSIDLYNRYYKLNPNSVQSKQKRAEYEKGLANGDYSIDETVRIPKLQRNITNPFTAIAKGYTNSKKAYDESVNLKGMSNDDAIKYLNNKFSKEDVMPEKPKGISGWIGETLGGFTRLFAKQTVGEALVTSGALVLAPETGGLTLSALALLGGIGGAAEEISTQEYGAALQKYYLQGKQEGLNDKQSIEKARTQASRAEKIGVAEAGAFALGGKAVKAAVPRVFSAPVTGAGVKQMAGKFIQATAPEVAGATAAVVSSSVAKDISARQLGYKVQEKEMFDNAWDAASENLKFMGMLMGVHSIANGAKNIPKYLNAQMKGFVSKAEPGVPEMVLDNLADNGILNINEISKTKEVIKNFKKAKSDIEPLKITDEAVEAAIAGKQEKKNKLESEIQELNKNKIPVGVEEKQAEIKKLDEEIRGIYETGDVGKYEVDSDFPDVQEAKMLTREELTPTIKIGEKEYTGADHGQAMKKAIEAGEKIPSPETPEGEKFRQEQGLFKEAETGKLLTREESKAKYGIERSSELAPVEAKVEPIQVEKPVEEKRGMRMADVRRLDTIAKNKEIERIGDAVTPRQAVMLSLLRGRKLSIKDFAKQLGATGTVKVKGKEISEAEASPFTDKKSKQTIDEAAHQIWESNESLQQYDDMVIKEELMKVLGEYTDAERLKDQYIVDYSEAEIDKAYEEWYMKTQMIDKDFVDLGDDAIMKKADWEKWMNNEISAEEAGMADELVIEDLINKYEQELTREGAKPPTAVEGKVPERAVGADVKKPEGTTESPAEIRGETPAYDEAGFRDEQYARDAYERERDPEIDESFDEWLHNKNCGEV